VTAPIAGQAGEKGKTGLVTVPRGGIYSVSVRFPRGDDLVRQVSVGDGQTLEVTIDLAESPHEYLAWQQFSGSVRERPYEPEPAAEMAEAPEGRVGDLLNAGNTRLRNLYDDERTVPTVSFASVAPGRPHGSSSEHPTPQATSPSEGHRPRTGPTLCGTRNPRPGSRPRRPKRAANSFKAFAKPLCPPS
jgi:hypothetical protein